MTGEQRPEDHEPQVPEDILARYLELLESEEDPDALLAAEDTAELRKLLDFQEGLALEIPPPDEASLTRARSQMHRQLRWRRLRRWLRLPFRRPRLWVVTGSLGIGLSFGVAFADQPGRMVQPFSAVVEHLTPSSTGSQGPAMEIEQVLIPIPTPTRQSPTALGTPELPDTPLEREAQPEASPDIRPTRPTPLANTGQSESVAATEEAMPAGAIEDHSELTTPTLEAGAAPSVVAPTPSPVPSTEAPTATPVSPTPTVSAEPTPSITPTPATPARPTATPTEVVSTPSPTQTPTPPPSTPEPTPTPDRIIISPSPTETNDECEDGEEELIDAPTPVESMEGTPVPEPTATPCAEETPDSDASATPTPIIFIPPDDTPESKTPPEDEAPSEEPGSSDPEKPESPSPSEPPPPPPLPEEPADETEEPQKTEPSPEIESPPPPE